MFLDGAVDARVRQAVQVDGIDRAAAEHRLARIDRFRRTYRKDLRSSGDRLRADYVRRSLDTDRPVSEVISGRRGFITGVDANSSPAAVKAMSSDRWGAVTREQRLLNPHLYVRGLLARPSLASAGRSRRLGGRLHRVLVVRGDIAPVRLFVDARTGRVDRLTTVDHNHNRGDVRTVVDFRVWRASGGGRVRFPLQVTLRARPGGRCTPIRAHYPGKPSGTSPVATTMPTTRAACAPSWRSGRVRSCMSTPSRSSRGGSPTATRACCAFGSTAATRGPTSWQCRPPAR